MEAKNFAKKQRGKSAEKIHNNISAKITKKENKINNIKKIQSINLVNNIIPTKKKNERALSDQNNEKKIFSNNSINNRFPKQKKVQRPKSYNIIYRSHKNENTNNKKKSKCAKK